MSRHFLVKADRLFPPDHTNITCGLSYRDESASA
jgi:hypothetical protein